jgi:hypothetical protein
MYGMAMNSWNTPTIYRPAYTVIDNYTIHRPNSTLLFSLGTTDISNTGDITFWYSAAVQGLDLYSNTFVYGADDDRWSFPMELQELVILYSVRSVMQRIDAQEALGSIVQQIAMLENGLEQNYHFEKLKQPKVVRSKRAEMEATKKTEEKALILKDKVLNLISNNKLIK